MNTPNVIASTITMNIASGYTDDPAYSYTLPTPTTDTLTVMPLTLQTVTDVTRVIDTANSWKANVNLVEATDELTTVIQKKNFSVDANTT